MIHARLVKVPSSTARRSTGKFAPGKPSIRCCRWRVSGSKKPAQALGLGGLIWLRGRATAITCSGGSRGSLSFVLQSADQAVGPHFLRGPGLSMPTDQQASCLSYYPWNQNRRVKAILLIPFGQFLVLCHQREMSGYSRSVSGQETDTVSQVSYVSRHSGAPPERCPMYCSLGTTQFRTYRRPARNSRSVHRPCAGGACRSPSP